MDKISRRQLIGVAAGSAAAGSIVGQVVMAQTPASPATDAQTFEKAARDSHRENSATLAAFNIPMSLEPAFQFRA